MVFITGDTHGDFERIKDFCNKIKTTKEDIMIILGDVGINFSGLVADERKKEYLEALPITLFCIYGNHEQRPSNIKTYVKKEWHGGTVYVEEQYPDIIFAKDGEIYDIYGKKAIVIGGAYSVDKQLRIVHGWGWWPDEQPSTEIKQYVEEQLQKRDWKIDVVLSHTIPRKYEPVETFMPGIDQSRVDKSTENWLDALEEKLEYDKWYCGHYHIEKKVKKVEIMFQNIEEYQVS